MQNQTPNGEQAPNGNQFQNGGQAPYGSQPPNGGNVPNDGKGLSVAGLVLGIIAAVLGWFTWISIAALVCGIIGIVCAAKGKSNAVAAGAPTGLGTAGFVLSVIGTCLAGIGFMACTICPLVCTGSIMSAL